MRKPVWILSLILAINLLYIPYAARAQSNGKYSSLDAWYEAENLSTENTYNDSTEWTWQFKDSGSEWLEFSTFHTARQSFGMTPKNVIGKANRISGAAWTTDRGAYNHPAVGRGWMVPRAQSGKADNAVCKAFTAPESGTVKLSADGGYIYGGSNNPGGVNNRTAFIRITKNDEQIWPANNEGLRLPEDAPEQEYRFEPVMADVEAGDVLRFEVYNGDSDDNGTGKYVYWIPVVSYQTEEEPVPALGDDGEYSSLDAWYETEDLGTENTYNGSTEWKWQRKDSGKDWFDFAAYHVNRQSFGMLPGNVIGSQNRVAGKAWTTGSGEWNHPAVGSGWMFPYGQIGKPDNAVSRAFTVPRDGTVELTAYNGYIYGGSNQPGKTNNRTAFIRITKNGEQIWPENGEGMRIPEDTPEQAYKFEPVKADAAQNDIIRFEVYNGDTNDSGSGKYVYWIPVISYGYDKTVNIEPQSLDSVPVNQIFTLTFPEVIDEITDENISISSSDSSAKVNNITQSSDGKSVMLTFDGLKNNSRYDVRIKGIKPSDGDGNGFVYNFSFATEDVFEYPVYESDAAWPNTLTADTMKNDDTVWRFLYKNDATKNTLNPYMPYELTAQNSTQRYVKPAQKEDGTYDYATVLDNSSPEITRVYCDEQTSAYAHNCLGRWWARLAVATQSEPKQSVNNEIVKSFTAPETGVISILAKDLSGESKIYNRRFTEANVKGAVLKIVKKNDAGEDIDIWEHYFEYTAATIPENGLGVYNFEPIELDIKKGEELYFIISGEKGGSAYAKQVFWNPVVAYTDVHPNIVSMVPDNKSTGAALNFEQKITFDCGVADIGLEDIEIDNGASAESISTEDNQKTLCIRFANLKPDTEYNVKLRNIRIVNAYDSNGCEYDFSFKTGEAVQVGGIYLKNNELSAGANIVCADINNASGVSGVGAALMASVCRGTEKDYEIVSTDTVYRRDIGENDTLKIFVNVPDTSDYFIKAVLLNSIPSAKALLPMKVFKK